MNRMLCILFAVFFTLAGCDESSDDGPPAATYTVRGQVKSLSESERHLSLHHEAIPDFRNREGDVVGMDPMVMNFEVAAGVPFDDMKSGDLVEASFEMRWQGGSELRITALTKLPEGTALKLEADPLGDHSHH